MYAPLKEYMDLREATLVEIGKIKGIDNKYGNVASQHYYLKNTMLTQPYKKFTISWRKTSLSKSRVCSILELNRF